MGDWVGQITRSAQLVGTIVVLEYIGAYGRTDNIIILNRRLIIVELGWYFLLGYNYTNTIIYYQNTALHILLSVSTITNIYYTRRRFNSCIFVNYIFSLIVSSCSHGAINVSALSLATLQ